MPDWFPTFLFITYVSIGLVYFVYTLNNMLDTSEGFLEKLVSVLPAILLVVSWPLILVSALLTTLLILLFGKGRRRFWDELKEMLTSL